jgi:hypothetical protein
LLEPLKVGRILAGLHHAARTGETFHLWWHPHNFGTHLEENMASLRTIVTYIDALRREGQLVSATMEEAATP